MRDSVADRSRARPFIVPLIAFGVLAVFAAIGLVVSNFDPPFADSATFGTWGEWAGAVGATAAVSVALYEIQTERRERKEREESEIAVLVTAWADRAVSTSPRDDYSEAWEGLERERERISQLRELDDTLERAQRLASAFGLTEEEALTGTPEDELGVLVAKILNPSPSLLYDVRIAVFDERSTQIAYETRPTVRPLVSDEPIVVRLHRPGTAEPLRTVEHLPDGGAGGLTVELEFTDGPGRRWTRNRTGRLRRSADPPGELAVIPD